MKWLRSPADAPVLTAMLGAFAFTAQFVGGKTVRDTLYLRQLPVETLPRMIVVTSLATLAGVLITSQAIRRVSSSRFVSALFLLSATLFIVEWLFSFSAPRGTAIALYLHIAGLGPMLGSGFWLVVSERFDPHTAKQRFGQLAAAGTIGGLIGPLLASGADRFLTMSAMLPLLAALNVFCIWQIRRLAPPKMATPQRDVSDVLMTPEPESMFRVLSEAPYLRNLAALVLLGTIGAGFFDYVFKANATAYASSIGGDRLGQYFAIYNGSVSVLTFIIQTAFSRKVLERLGLATATGAPSAALIVAGLVGLLVPPLRTAFVVTARGGEAILRASLFRSGYELFYTPLAVAEKRAAKSMIDVGCDRLGELVGAVGIQLALLTLVSPNVTILVLGIITSVAAVSFANRLNHGYVAALERSLLNRAVELDLSDVEDLTTRTVMLRTLQQTRRMRTTEPHAPAAASGTPTASAAAATDPDVRKIVALRSRDRRAILDVLDSGDELSGALVPHVIQLLAWDPVAEHAIRALRSVAEYRVGELTDALLDPSQPFAVRRRLARVFSVCVSQRAADGLVAALDDLRFEVRYQCARSLAAILEKNPRVRINAPVIYEVVRREVEVGRPVWEGHRLLDRVDDDVPDRVVDAYLKGRANQSLTHVFTLLSLVIPAEPLRIAFRGLHTNDPNLRGTSLEYLEGVLPPAIHQRLRPFLEERPARPAPARPREEVLAQLLRSSDSILLNLEELKRQSGLSAHATSADSPEQGKAS
jgi:AAA family ATP:ADP antiporter